MTAERLSGLTYHAVKQGIKITPDLVKEKARESQKDWTADGPTTEKIINRINDLGYHEGESQAAYCQRLSNDNELNQLLSPAQQTTVSQNIKNLQGVGQVKGDIVNPVFNFGAQSDNAVKPPSTTTESPTVGQPTALWEKVAGFVFGVVFTIVLLVLVVWIPNPTATQYTVFKTVLALSGAGVGAILAGFIQVEGTLSKLSIRAGGALVLFVLVYFFSPAPPTPLTQQDAVTKAALEALTTVDSSIHTTSANVTINQTMSGGNGIQIGQNTGVINIGDKQAKEKEGKPATEGDEP